MLTSNLEQFGVEGLHEAKQIMEAWLLDGLPSKFYDAGISIKIDVTTEMVYLINEDEQKAAYNPRTGKLEIYHVLPSGLEDFESEIINRNDTLSEEDTEYYSENVVPDHIW